MYDRNAAAKYALDLLGWSSLSLALTACASAQTTVEPYATTTARTNPARAVPTFNSIGLYWTPGGTLGTSGCQVQFRKTGDATWRTGLPLWYDKRNKECRGSLVQLVPGTSYDIQLSVSGASQQLAAQTWSESFPVDSAQTVTLSGTSAQTLTITQGGTPGHYKLYTSDPASPATIDVGNAQSYDVVIAAPYVIVRGLTLKGAQQDGIRLMDSAHDVVIENNDISGWGRTSGTTSALGYTIGANLDSGVRAVCSTGNLVRVVVQRNRIHDPRYGANSWSEGHPNGPQGITFSYCGGNNVFRYNEIYSTPGSSTGHYYNDGIGGEDNFTTTGFPNEDSDIYGNRIENTWDDCVEAEGGDTNVRVWNNYCNNTTTGIASSTVSIGPLYIFRNVYNRSRQLELVPLDSDQRNVFAKAGTYTPLGAGRRYIFHNTLLQASQAGATYGLGAASGASGSGSKQLLQNTVSRNNIFQLWRPDSPVFFQVGSGNDFGWDLYTGPASSLETNGIRGTPVYLPDNGWTSESGGMYQQDPSSPGFDKAVRIPNFNDDFKGAAPDIGAQENGAPAMVFGVAGGL